VIALARVDDRLMHGQVSVGWVPHVRATIVVVANDRIAGDPLLSGIVRAGASGVRVETIPVAEAARRGASAAWERETVIVLFESLQDARRAIEAGLPVTRLNLGGLRHDQGLVCLCDGVTLDTDDCAILRELVSRGVQVDVRLMPRDRACALPPLAPGAGP
jgi:mannose/fructose/N-acetylgalactosamine-specific phosphotransferase system component IIB